MARFGLRVLSLQEFQRDNAQRDHRQDPLCPTPLRRHIWWSDSPQQGLLLRQLWRLPVRDIDAIYISCAQRRSNGGKFLREYPNGHNRQSSERSRLHGCSHLRGEHCYPVLCLQQGNWPSLREQHAAQLRPRPNHSKRPQVSRQWEYDGNYRQYRPPHPESGRVWRH